MDAATFLQLGMAVVAGVFRAEQEKDRAAASERPIESLVAEAKARGMMPGELAARLGASVPLLGKLNRRLLHPASIPGELVADLATTLGRREEAIALYLARPSTLSAGGFHRAKDKPAIADREDFFEAVRSDPALSEEHRVRWLSLAPRGKASS